MLRIGVVGVGHLGKIHLKILANANFVTLVGFYDANIEVASEVEKELGVKAFTSYASLLEACEVIDIVTPTFAHYSAAAQALEASKHVFIEKPLANSLEEAEALVQLANEAGLKVQVGHVERFNPAFVKASNYLNDPKFIEIHRLALFNPRGTDVSVVLDLMIHDIDVVLSVVQSKISQIHASGVSVVSDTPDIANVRIEFENGCVANLTASRISLKNMRKSRFFQKDAYISVDFLEKKTEIIKMQDVVGEENPFAVILDLGKKGKKQIDILQEEAEPVNAIEEELKSFIHSIENNQSPSVSIEDGHEALKVALDIMQKIG